MPLIPGQVLNNRYRIVKLLGQGGYGAVYKAWDTNVSGAVALKENFDTSPAAQSQFAREATILFNLRHPNLPRVSDHFSLPGQGQYLVMDFIEGEDLEELCLRSGGRLDEAQVLPWIGQVLDALVYMHAQQPPVIHRDIKPANIKISSGSDPTQPAGKAILVDFGVAKVYDPNQRTMTGARAITPGYAPFEQYGHRPTDTRTDIYAIGATLYRLLTGQEPPESIDRMGGTPLLNPRQLNPAITLETASVIIRALELQPAQRFQSAIEFKSALLAQTANSTILSLGAKASSAVSANQSPPIVTLPIKLPPVNLPTVNLPAFNLPVVKPISRTFFSKPAHWIPWVFVGILLVILISGGILGRLFLPYINSGDKIIKTENALATLHAPTVTIIPDTPTPLIPTSTATRVATITGTSRPTITPSATFTFTPTSSITPVATRAIQIIIPWQARTFSGSSAYIQFQVTFTLGVEYIIAINNTGDCVSTHTYLYDKKFNILGEDRLSTQGPNQIRYKAISTGTYYIRVYNTTDPHKSGACTEFWIGVSVAP